MQIWTAYRQVVAHASGMVSVQAGCSIAAAITLLENVAAARCRTLEEIATMVIEREIHFRD